MAEERGYQGWANYETWAVNLWIDNDQGSLDYWNERAEGAMDAADGDREEAARILADHMKDEHEEGIPEAVNGTVYADLLNGALSEVDWIEVAETKVEEVEWEEDEDD